MEPRTPSTRRGSRTSDDEAEYGNRWPKASRYWNPDEREMFQAYIPGWFPGCDLNNLNAGASGILWPEWERIRGDWRMSHPGARV